MLRKLWVRNPVIWGWLRGCASVLVVLAAAALAFLVVSVAGLPSGGQGVPVPNVVGEPEAKASEMLAEVGLGSHVAARNYHEQVPPGHVIASEPHALMRVRAGRRVELVVSTGPRKVAAPKVVGLALDEAQTLIKRTGLAVGRITRQHSDEPVDRVISQEPDAGKRLPRGEKMNLVASGGPDFGRLKAPDGQVVLLRRLRIVVPAGRVVQRVRVTLDQRYGLKTIYDRIHRPGDQIVVDFSAAHGDRLHVYVDEKLAERKRL